YGILRDELEQRGVDPGQIAFIHDAGDDEERAELFEQCRDGRVRVLVGSTQLMGTGVNVQRRAVALHHVDVPWRPDQLEQREGRLIRQGNENSEVEVHTYITSGTVDVMSWQTIERKAAFIGQITKGTTTERTLEQDEESMEQVARTIAALAADSPLVMERVEVLNEIARLGNLETAHRTEFGAAKGRLRSIERDISLAQQGLPRLESVLAAIQPDAATIVSDGSQPETATETAEAIRATLRSAGPAIAAGERPLIASVQGIDFVASPQRQSWRIHAAGSFEVGFDLEPSKDTLAKTNVPVRLANQLEKLPDRVAQERGRIAEGKDQASELRAFVETDQGFPEAAALRSAELRLAEIDTELGMTDDGEVAERVFASEMRGRVPLPEDRFGLRVGDAFKIRGEKEQFTVVRSEGRDHYIVAEGSDEEQLLPYSSKVEAASRLRSEMTEWEQACVDLAETDSLERPAGLDDGTAVLVPIQRGEAIVPVEGVIDQGRRGQGMLVRVTDPSAKDERIAPTTHVIVTDRWTPQQVEARRASETMIPAGALYPGEIITAAVDETFTRSEERRVGKECGTRGAP